MPKGPLCRNEDHVPRLAVVRTTWPTDRFEASYACRSCLRMLIAMYVLSGEFGGPCPMTLEPVKAKAVAS